MNTNSASSQPDKVSSLLVIGYGNPTHGDNAIGRQVTKLIQALSLPNVEVCAVEQLTPELSTKLATADYVIFVDACYMKKAGVKVSTLEACGLETAGSSGWSHELPPCSLLALTQSVYGRHPQSWWVEVAAQNFETGHPLSHRANQSIQNAVEQIEALIHQCRPGPQISQPQLAINESIEKVNKAIEDCKAKGTSTYITLKGKPYLVTPQGVMSYEGTATVAYSQSKRDEGAVSGRS